MAEKEVQYIEFVKNRFPQLNINKIDFNLKDEKYADLVTINDEIVFKFSKYDWTVAFLENEVNMISFLQPDCSIPLPIIERLEKGIAKYSLIKGVPLIRDDILLLGNKEQDYIAEQIGVFLRALHTVSLKTLKDRKISESPVNLTRQGWLAEFEEIQRKVFPYCENSTKDAIQRMTQPVIENDDFFEYEPALIHGGLVPQHFFFDKDRNRINGITGFELSGIGDPAYDISVLIMHFGETFTKRISRYYRNINPIVDRARFYVFANHLSWTKKVSDMITTRDFSNFQFLLHESDIMPIGCKW